MTKKSRSGCFGCLAFMVGGIFLLVTVVCFTGNLLNTTAGNFSEVEPASWRVHLQWTPADATSWTDIEQSLLAQKELTGGPESVQFLLDHLKQAHTPTIGFVVLYHQAYYYAIMDYDTSVELCDTKKGWHCYILYFSDQTVLIRPPNDAPGEHQVLTLASPAQELLQKLVLQIKAQHAPQ